MICDNGEYLAKSAVIAVEESSMKSNELKDQMKKFTNNLEAKIGNNFMPIFEPSNLGKIYYSPFDTIIEEDS